MKEVTKTSIYDKEQWEDLCESWEDLNELTSFDGRNKKDPIEDKEGWEWGKTKDVTPENISNPNFNKRREAVEKEIIEKIGKLTWKFKTMNFHVSGETNTNKHYIQYYQDKEIVYDIHVYYGDKFGYKYNITVKERTRELKTITYTSSTKVYDIKTYTKVDEPDIYASYSVTNETGIQWDDDKVKNVAQQKAIDNGQLTRVGNKYANNFDYVAALNLKHLKEKYDQAKGDVATAQGKTQELENKIKKLTAEYNGIKAEGENQVSQEPTSDLYKTLKELDQMIAGLRRNLADARHELGVAIQNRNTLEEKVEEARRAVASIDLSRFNGSGEEDEPTGGTPDTTGGTPDTTGDTTTTGGPAITTLGTPSGVAGVRTGGGTGRGRGTGTGTGTGTGIGEGTGEGTAPADNTVAKNNTSTIEETELPGAAEAPSSNLQDTDLPGAQGATDNNANLWWLWAAIALLIALGYGTYKYVDNKKKANNTIQK